MRIRSDFPFGIHRSAIFAALLGVVSGWTGCRHKLANPTLAPALAGDSIELVNVRQTSGHVLKPGTPAHFIVRVNYKLESRDEGVLTLGLDQSRSTESCVPDVNGEPLKTIVTERIAISRGMHSVEIPLVWDGSGETGAITLEASLWSKTPSYKFLTRWFGTQFCQRF